MAKRRKLGEAAPALREVTAAEMAAFLQKQADLEKKPRTLDDGSIAGEGGILTLDKKAEEEEAQQQQQRPVVDNRRHQAGVLEVELGQEYRQKNVQATEEALKKLATKPKVQHTKPVESELYSINYSKRTSRPNGRERECVWKLTFDLFVFRCPQRLS